MQNVTGLETYVTCPGTATDTPAEQLRKEEIGREMNVSWMAEKNKWRSVKHRFVFAKRRPLLDVLRNIHPNVRYTGKYKGSDSYIV